MSPTLILFIDDSTDDVVIAQQHLTHGGVPTETLRAQSKAELAALLARRSIALIVSDFHVQFWEGFDILEAARSLAPGVPFIFHSGLLLPAQVTLALGCGAYGCVNKAEAEAFVRLVKSALQRAGTRARS